MILDIVTKGTTDYSCTLRIVDATTGAPATGLTFASAGIDLWYRRPQSAHTSITEATQTESGAHSDGGFVEISDGNYRLDLPDAAVATGVDYVDVGGTITGYVVIGGRIRLTSVNLQDSVRGGMTALPNAAADAAGGLPISDAGGLDLDSIKTDTAAILVDTGSTLDGRIPAALVNGRMDATVDATGMEAGALALINAEVVDAVNVDTMAEMGSAVPPLAPTMRQALNYLYRWMIRNKKTVDSSSSPTVETVFADDGTTPIFKRNISDSANVTTFDETAAGS